MLDRLRERWAAARLRAERRRRDREIALAYCCVCDGEPCGWLCVHRSCIDHDPPWLDAPPLDVSEYEDHVAAGGNPDVFVSRRRGRWCVACGQVFYDGGANTVLCAGCGCWSDDKEG